MLPNDLTHPIYSDADEAREFLESVRWPAGPYCPHCGARDEEVTRLAGKKHRTGLFQCKICFEQFTVSVGTLYERSHIPLNKWLLATHLMCASKKGISAHQLMRLLGLGSYRSAWFMAHRIREGMQDTSKTPLGGMGKTVEIDETYIGGKEGNKHRSKRRRGPTPKQAVFALVERGGKVRSHHVPVVNSATLRPILMAQAQRTSVLMSDEASHATMMGKEFLRHGRVDHSRERYVRGEAHTNTVEGFFSILKRSIIGTFHHVSEQHLKRYLVEADFKYSNRAALGVDDTERTIRALKGIEGKRLTYRRPRGADNAQTEGASL